MNLLKHHFALFVVAAILLFVTIACGGSVTSLPTSTPASSATAETWTPLASPTQLTATSLPTSTTVPPTFTSTAAPQPSIPTTSNLPTATRINFSSGATNSATQGTINAGQTLYYVLRALDDQPMIVMLDTPDQGAKLSIFGANGTSLLSQSQQTTSWQGYLPSTQDYYFGLTESRSTQNFTLNVNIPARIEFSSGENQVTLRGQTVGGYSVMYTAYAFGGQELDVTINTAPNVAGLTIWGFSDGQPYARAQNGVTSFNMTLPSTQDYIIQVVPQGGTVVDYELNVKIQ